jgi:hypothetical protein
MQSLRIHSILVAFCLLTACGGEVLFSRNTPVAFQLPGLATVELPKKWVRVGDHFDRKSFTLYRFEEDTKHDWGGQSHERGYLCIALLAPDASIEDTAKAAAETYGAAMERTTKPVWIDQTGAAASQRRFGEANYDWNNIKEPVWVLQRVDREKGILFTFRGWKKKYDRKNMEEIADRLVATLTWSPDRAEYFGDVRDRPRRAQEKATSQLSKLNEVLKQYGLPPAQTNRWIEHSGILYQYSPDDRWPWFHLVEKVGERKLERPALGELLPLTMQPPPGDTEFQGLAWYVYHENRWEWIRPFGGWDLERMAAGQTDESKAYFWYGCSIHLLDDPDPVAKLKDYFQSKEELKKKIATAPLR